MTDLLAAKRRVLTEQLGLCRRAAAALQHTWRKLNQERIGESDLDLLEALEALTARFACLEDTFIKRVFRAVAAVELSDVERLLDVLDLMERLHLIAGTEQWVELKELRNAIVHEYELDDLPALQRRVYQAVPILLDSLDAWSYRARTDRSFLPRYRSHCDIPPSCSPGLHPTWHRVRVQGHVDARAIGLNGLQGRFDLGQIEAEWIHLNQ